jgi:hypothetical protein
LKRIARNVIIQSILDYAKAHRILNRESATEQQKARALSTQRDVSDMFAEGRDNPWLELSEFNLEWLCRSFSELASDPEKLLAVNKLRYVD